MILLATIQRALWDLMSHPRMAEMEICTATVMAMDTAPVCLRRQPIMGSSSSSSQNVTIGAGSMRPTPLFAPQRSRRSSRRRPICSFMSSSEKSGRVYIPLLSKYLFPVRICATRYLTLHLLASSTHFQHHVTKRLFSPSVSPFLPKSRTWERHGAPHSGITLIFGKLIHLKTSFR